MERLFGQPEKKEIVMSTRLIRYSVILFLIIFVTIANADIGPRLTDKEFFTGLNLDAPGLAKLKTAVQNEDWQAAKREFAGYIRTRTKPEWFIDWRSRPKPKTPRANTDNADKVLNNKFNFGGKWYDLGEKIDWASNQTKGKSFTIEWNADLNRHYQLRDLSRAYWNTGEEKYAAKIVELMLDWITNCPVLVDGDGIWPYHYAWHMLNSSVRTGVVWPNVIYRILDSKAMSDNALCIIFKSLVEHARRFDRYLEGGSGNALTSMLTAHFIIGSLLPEFIEATTWRKHAINRLHKQLCEEIYPDGLQYEFALSYSNWVLQMFASVVDLSKLNNRMSEIPENFLNLMENMYNYQTYAMMPNWKVPGLGDSGDCSPVGLLKKGKAFFPNRQDFIWIASKGQEGKMPEKESTAFPYSGHYVIRSGWDKDARYLHFAAGPFSEGSHGHEDKLHFIVYAYGKKLLLDAGNYIYGSSIWRFYVLSTRGHNTIRVDGRDQSRSDRASVLPSIFQPLDNLWVSEKNFDYVVGRYESGYKKAAIDVKHKRAILFVKPDYWIIIDTLKPEDNKPHEYESIFHLNAETAVKIPNTKAVVTENSNSANLVLWPVGINGLSTEIVKGIEEEPVQGWVMSWTKREAVPTALFRWKAKGISQLVTIVYPIPANAEVPILRVKQLRISPQTTDAIAVQIEFTNGEKHLVFYTDKVGRKYRYGSHETESGLEFIKLNKRKKEIARFQQDVDRIYPREEEWKEGEKIITHYSGTYGWDDNQAVLGYCYDKDGHMKEKTDFTTLITDKGTKATVDLAEGEMAVIKKLPITILPTNKAVRLDVDYYDDTKAKFTLSNLWLSLKPKKSYYFNGEEAEIEVTLNNYSPHSIRTSLSVETPDNWKIVSPIKECVVPEGKVGTYKFKVRIPEGEEAGRFRIKVAADNYSLKSTAYVNVRKPLEVDAGQCVFKYSTSHILGELPVTITNLLSDKSTGTVRLELGKGWEINPSKIKYKLSPEEERTVKFTLRRNLDESSDESGVKIIATSNGSLITKKQVLYPSPPICIVKSNFKPLIDGRLDEQGWEKAAKFTGFISLTTGKLAKNKSTVYLSYDDKNLYIGAKFQDPDIKAKKRRRDEMVNTDDCIEIDLDTNHDRKTCYRLLVNSLGTKADHIHDLSNRIECDWEWQADISVGKDFWVAEMAIPFASITDKAPEVGDIWGFNVNRYDYSEIGVNRYSRWSNMEAIGKWCFAKYCGDLIFR